MQARIAGLADDFAASAQPDPMAAGVSHAEGVVDRGGARFGEIGRQRIQFKIVGVHQRVDVAEAEQIVLGLEAENVEHRLRPEDAAARQVPVPQAAAAAIERGVDAAAHGLIDDVGLAGAGRLPVKGKAEDQHDEAGGGRQSDRQRGQRAPRRQRRVARLHGGQLAEGCVQQAHGGECRRAAGQDDFHHAGAGAKGGERLRRAEQVDQTAADGEIGGGDRRDHNALIVGQQKAAAGAGRPGRQRRGQQLLRTLDYVAGILERLNKTFGGDVGDGVE